MKLEDFVSKTILDITTGVQKAIDNQETGVKVNPDDGTKPSSAKRTISFDLNVLPYEENVEVNPNASYSNPNIKFDIDVILPSTRA